MAFLPGTRLANRRKPRFFNKIVDTIVAAHDAQRLGTLWAPGIS
jgi:hypothetical protein